MTNSTEEHSAQFRYIIPYDLNLPDCENISQPDYTPQIPKLLPQNRKASRSVLRRRRYIRMHRNERSNLLSAIVDNPFDIRPYAEITILGNKYSRLLDTGASISCIGGTFANKLISEQE